MAAGLLALPALSAEPAAGIAPLAVSFTATPSGGNSSAYAYAWAFGDGATSTLTFTLDDVDPGDAISWAATLAQTPATIGVLDVLSGGPVAPGAGVTLHYTMLEACPSGRATCTATVQITVADAHGGMSSESAAITLQ